MTNTSTKEYKKALKIAERLMAKTVTNHKSACYIEIGQSINHNDIYTNHVDEIVEDLKTYYENNGFECTVRDESHDNHTKYTLIINL